MSVGEEGTLDAPCLPDKSCIINHAYCNQLVCKCQPDYFEKNDNCFPRIELGDPCSTGEFCLDENGECLDGNCVCKPGFFEENAECSKLIYLF